MKILLDTQIFLWFISADIRLSTDVRDAIRDPDNEVYLSAVSVWEAIVKYQLGKLPLPEPPEIYLPKQRDIHQIVSLALDESSVAQLANLPPLHRDPFDRKNADLPSITKWFDHCDSRCSSSCVFSQRHVAAQPNFTLTEY